MRRVRACAPRASGSRPRCSNRGSALRSTCASRDSRPRYSRASAARCSPRSHELRAPRRRCRRQALGPDVEILHVGRRDEAGCARCGRRAVANHAHEQHDQQQPRARRSAARPASARLQRASRTGRRSTPATPASATLRVFFPAADPRRAVAPWSRWRDSGRPCTLVDRAFDLARACSGLAGAGSAGAATAQQQDAARCATGQDANARRNSCSMSQASSSARRFRYMPNPAAT